MQRTLSIVTESQSYGIVRKERKGTGKDIIGYGQKPDALSNVIFVIHMSDGVSAAVQPNHRRSTEENSRHSVGTVC